MHGAAKLGKADFFSVNQFFNGQFPSFGRAENGMTVRIDGLGDAEVEAALAHHFQVSKQAFILGHIKPDNIASSIIDSAMKGIFEISAKPFIRSGVNLDELSGMGLTFTPVGTVADFFFMGLFIPALFSILEREEYERLIS